MERIELDEFTECLKKSWSLENYERLEKFIEKIEAEKNQDKRLSEGLQGVLEYILYKTPMNGLHMIWFLSALASVFPNEKYINLILKQALYNEDYSTVKEYLSYQIKSFLFNQPEYASVETKRLQNALHQKICSELRSQVDIHPKRKEERNRNKVIVMTANFLSERHAPTHSTLERCMMLKNILGAEVSIVSTTENVFYEPGIPYYKGWMANCMEELNGLHLYPYKGQEYLLYQESEFAYSPEGVQNIINYVEEVNPYYMIYIGGESVIADILNEFCPVMTISTVFSSVPNGNTAFKMVGRKVAEEERVDIVGKIIETPFTFELAEKKHTFTRAELGIPADQWAMAVVGNRLDADVKDDFLETMQKVENGYLVFIGNFVEYEKKKQKYPWLEEHSVSLGYVTDVIGVLECMDLYVNPKRLGGGFSVVEAFHAGIPAVSIQYGDVAIAAGEDFCVSGYEDMLKKIDCYQSDAAFYKKMIGLAKDREEELTNGEAAFKIGVEEMLSSESFY